MVICLERGADLHMLMPLPLTVSCFSKIQIGFAFLVPAHPGRPGKRVVKRVCVCVCVCVCVLFVITQVMECLQPKTSARVTLCLIIVVKSLDLKMVTCCLIKLTCTIFQSTTTVTGELHI